MVKTNAKMEKYTLITLAAGYNEITDITTTISIYKTDKMGAVSVELVSTEAYDIEWFTSNQICNDWHKVVKWLLLNGSAITQKSETSYELSAVSFTSAMIFEEAERVYTNNPFTEQYYFNTSTIEFNSTTSVKRACELRDICTSRIF